MHTIFSSKTDFHFHCSNFPTRGLSPLKENSRFKSLLETPPHPKCVMHSLQELYSCSRHLMPSKSPFVRKGCLSVRPLNISHIGLGHGLQWGEKQKYVNLARRDTPSQLQLSSWKALCMRTEAFSSSKLLHIFEKVGKERNMVFHPEIFQSETDRV